MVSGNYVPVDNLMLALINSKSYASGDVVLKTADLKQSFKTLNTIVDSVLNDINKSMLADNSF